MLTILGRCNRQGQKKMTRWYVLQCENEVQDVVSNTQRLERISQSNAILKYKADKKAKLKEAKSNQKKQLTTGSDQDSESEGVEPIVIDSDEDYY
jgi:hypothetical protein